MHYKADDLPFDLEFFTDNSLDKISQVKEYWGKGQVAPQSTRDLIQIKEGIQIGVRLYAKEGHYADENAKVVLESGNYDEEGKQIMLQIPITHPNSLEYLFKNRKNEVYPWRLGVYFFEVHYGDVIYASAIFVSPIHLSMEQVQHMHLLLEKEVEGICYELIYTSKSTGNQFEALEGKAYYSYVLRLMNEKEKIYSALSYIERNLHTEVRTQYVEQPFEGKVDHKSLRWKTVHGNLMDFNKKKILSFDTLQNRWLKHVLLLWKQDLIRVEKQIGEDCKACLNKTRIKEEEKKVIEERHRLLQYEREISRASLESMESKKYRLGDEIKKIEREYQVLTRWDDLVKNIIGRFSYLLTTTEIIDVERSAKKPLLKDHNYRLISELYEEGKKVLFGNVKSQHVMQILKPTWKIYEQFVYFQVVDIFKRNGFRVSEECDVDSLLDLKTGYCIEMENESMLVHVWYDKLIYMREDAVATNELFFSPQLIQPDIRIDLYEKGGALAFLSSVALDAKHRKYKSLHNEKFTTHVVTQLSKYNNIYYLGKNTTLQNRRRSVVSTVICVYSRDRDAKVKQEEIPFVFIQLFPELDQDEITGYRELRDEIVGWVNENSSYLTKNPVLKK